LIKSEWKLECFTTTTVDFDSLDEQQVYFWTDNALQNVEMQMMNWSLIVYTKTVAITRILINMFNCLCCCNRLGLQPTDKHNQW